MSVEVQWSALGGSKPLLQAAIHQGKSVDTTTMAEVNSILLQSTSFLTHTHVAAFTDEIDILYERPATALDRIRSHVPDMLLRGLNSEYIVVFYVQACEILLSEREKRIDGKGDLPFSKLKLSAIFRASLFMLGFSTISYPAYRGAYFRCRARWASLSGRRGKARKLFLRAIAAHHDLEMRYEEAKSLREYGRALERWKIPGQARDQFNKAYDLFRQCGSKYDTDRLASSVDPDRLRDDAAPRTAGHEPDSSTSTTFSMSSEIDRIRLETLHDLSGSMSTVEDLDQLFRRILMAQMKVTGAGLGTLFLAPHEGKEQTSLSMDYEGRVLPTRDLFFTQSILDRVKGGAPVLEVGTPSQAGGSGSQSVFCVPIMKTGQFMGCVYLVNETVSGMFTEGAQQIALILATQSAILIENARLIARYRGLTENLEHTVDAQTRSLTEKNRELEEKTVRLLESERIKALLSNALVHDIKNLSFAIGTSLLSLDRAERDQRYRKQIQYAREACSDIAGLTSNMLDIARIDEGRLTLSRRPITSDWLRQEYGKHAGNPVFEAKNLAVSHCVPPDIIGLHADEYLLGRVLQNLFDNAGKYASPGGKVVFSVETHADGTAISLFSTGAPIPAEHRERIFEKYSRIGEEKTAYSKGLGLFFCRMALTAHQGKIWVDADETGNYFRMTFPRMAESMAE